MPVQSPQQTHTEIAVIGAGVIGICCAVQLRAAGHEVLLLDPSEVAGATSYGNAATLAEYGCQPIAQPGLWSELPGLLFGADSPFSIRWASLPRLLPWLLRFLAQCTPARARFNTELLARLLARTFRDYQPLLDGSPAAAALMQQRGCLYSFAAQPGLRAALAEMPELARLGVRQQALSAEEVVGLEAVFAGKTQGGILYPDSRHVSDPQAFVQALASPLLTEGRLVRGEVHRLATEGRGLRLELADGGRLRADRVVLAAGAWSATLARQLGDRIPLETERGYHLEFDTPNPPLSRPTCLGESAFYITPLQGRLRAAGTVELASLTAPANPRHLRYIERHLRQVFDLPTPASRSWLGMRPSLPDCLPVIGPSPRQPRVLYAFGHQHLGLTLGGVTARLIADALDGALPDWAQAFSSRRFG